MLSWIKGSKSEHPLADDRLAREMIAELPPLDPYKSLEELCYWLDTLGNTESLKLPRILEILNLIDQAAKNHQRKLSQDYLSSSARLQKFQEIRIWNALFSFWKHLADAYQLWLVRFQAGATGFGTLKGQMPVVAARALRALTLQLKLQLLRYGPVEPRVWKQMGRIYAYAEEKAVSTVSIMSIPEHSAGPPSSANSQGHDVEHLLDRQPVAGQAGSRRTYRRAVLRVLRDQSPGCERLPLLLRSE
jgi:hypothetical protein